MTLAKEHCEACSADAPRVDDAQIDSLTEQIPGWAVLDRDGINLVTKCSVAPPAKINERLPAHINPRWL